MYDKNPINIYNHVIDHYYIIYIYIYIYIYLYLIYIYMHQIYIGYMNNIYLLVISVTHEFYL